VCLRIQSVAFLNILFVCRICSRFVDVQLPELCLGGVKKCSLLATCVIAGSILQLLPRPVILNVVHVGHLEFLVVHRECHKFLIKRS